MPGEGNRDLEEVFDQAAGRIKEDYGEARIELAAQTAAIRARYTEQVAAIEQKYTRDPEAGLSEEMKIILKAGSARREEGAARSDQARRGFFGFNDRLGRVADKGAGAVVEVFEDHTYSEAGFDSVVINDLVPKEEIAMAGLPSTMTTTGAEGMLSNLVIKTLGMDELVPDETVKNRLARMVWGRELIVAKMVEKAKADGVEIGGGEVRERIDNLVFGMLGVPEQDREKLRETVNSIGVAMASEKGRVDMIRLASGLSSNEVKI